MLPLYPPRPKGKIPPSMLPKMEDRGIYLVQRKFNGDRCLLHCDHTGKITFYNRYGRKSSYQPKKQLRDAISSLKFEPGQEYWLDGELMHPTMSDTIILYDVLHAGQYLYGTSVQERLGLLCSLCGDPSSADPQDFAIKLSPNLWLADSYYNGFNARFRDMIHLPTIEGLVLKEVNARLIDWGHKPYEVTWQVRCRKPGTSYRF